MALHGLGGERGVLDTIDGTAIRAGDNSINREPLNTGRDRFFFPADVAVDHFTGEVYFADGYGNKRVAVFDGDGNFLRQWIGLLVVGFDFNSTWDLLGERWIT